MEGVRSRESSRQKLLLPSILFHTPYVLVIASCRKSKRHYHISLAVRIEKCMDRLNAELVSVISAAAHNTETVTREKTQNSIDHVSGSTPPVHKRMCE